ncbi:AMP-binding protein [Streptomyces sp. P17]|uniref:AMP-binding protein n=1 Tax=Streptomyces sp. P17 TaxID=3074716 RepID=UPI0028F45D9B|nr:AMP-binding protein [Streptomyces sp. P17]MDT9697996.1 AMP-binding protein [Streptomyces sp. P17]
MTSIENYTVTVLDRLKATGSRDAIVSGTRRISGTEAVDTILRYAAALRDTKLGDGDGVALFVKNSPEAVLLMLAAHFAGCRLVFVPPEPGNSELEAFIQRAQIKALFFDPAFEERAGQITSRVDVPHVFSIGRSSSATDFLAAVPDTTDLVPHKAADGRHVATLLYTAGTTGTPRLVTHRSGYYEALTRVSGRYGDEVSAEPKWLVCTLTTHTSGHLAFLIGTLTGATVILLRTFDAGTALSVMRSERVTSMMAVTPMLYELLDHPDCPAEGFPSLRTLFYTGVAAAPARLRQALGRFGPVLYQIYGASENGLVAELTPQEHDLTRPDSLASCGRPRPGAEVELRDTDGRPVPVGQVGELYVRSGTVMEGYWNDPERTAEVLGADGWFRSGDLARQDDQGYLYLVDRVKDIIVTARTAGNVYSRLLDDFLISLPEVKDAATIGLTGEDGGERVHVVLVPQDPARVPDPDVLTRQITHALGDLYAPASYSVAAALPQTAVGKTDKKALRAALLAAQP